MVGLLGRIVTDEFLVPEIGRSPTSGMISLTASSGLPYFAMMLLRSSSHEILIPHLKTSHPEYIGIPSLRNRIREIDSHQVTRKKVERYFEPLYEQLSSDSDWQKRLRLYVLTDFVYKVALSIKHEAQADIPMTSQMPIFLDELFNSLHGEAQVRLAQIQGLWNLYSKQESVPVLTFIPDIVGPDIYQRINDWLNESTITYLSQQRYLMGIPSKVKIAILRFKKRISDIRRDPAYKDAFNVTSDLMKFSGNLIPDFGNALSVAGDLLSKFANPTPKYNPPLVDLDNYRIETSKTRPYHSPGYDAVIIKADLTRVLNKTTGKWELYKQL